MLGKLLKYDLKGIIKFLGIFYLLAIFFSGLTRIFLAIENSFMMEVIGKICSGITISMIFNILINNMLRLWVRFRQNLYGDEAYLTHTLPIEKKTLYIAKILIVIITLFVSILVIGLSLFIAYYSKENLEFFERLLLPLADLYDSSIMGILLIILLVLFVEFINMLQVGYTGIILGHKMNNAKIGYSVLFSFGAYTVIQIFVLLIIFLLALFNPDMMNLFVTNEMVDVKLLKEIMYLTIGIYSLTFVINYIVNIKLFNKGVNVD